MIYMDNIMNFQWWLNRKRLYPSHLDIAAASPLSHADADLADMVPTGKILKRSNNLIPRGPKLPLHRYRQPPLHDEPRDLL